MKRLTRVENGKKICGVCTGLGQYFNVDPTVFRLVFAIMCVMGGSGILAYIIAAVIMPMEDYPTVD